MPKQPMLKKTKRRWLRRLVWSLLLIALVFAGMGTVVIIEAFDKIITSTFEGRKWQIPSHVYARPLELYVGAKQSVKSFEWELQQLGYRRVSTLTSAGQYHLKQNGSATEFRVYSRSFSFWDGNEPSQKIDIQFQYNRVAKLSNRQGKLALMRFEPLRIGGIYPPNAEDRSLVKIETVPQLLPQTLLTVEDQNFYQHHGISFKGILRALIANIKQGRTAQGGSTITQQLVKNFYLTNHRNLKRKIREAIMAIILEYRYSKNEILETYLNEIYFGQAGKRAIHGVGLASQYFFKQPVDELQPHQIALLVAMIKGPTYYNPWQFPERSLQRRNLVLTKLRNNRIISTEQMQSSKDMPLDISSKPSLQLNRYPSMMDLLKLELRQQFKAADLTGQGYSFYTSLDPQIQRQVDDSISQQLKRIETAYNLTSNSLQAAAIVTRVGTGEIVAISGDRNPHSYGFNRAINAIRPIGSLIKPFTYMVALQQSSAYRLSSLIDDSTFSIEAADNTIWSPQNYDKKQRGLVDLSSALANSINIPAARVGLDVGIDSVLGMVQNLGIDRAIHNYPSTLLGAAPMTPLDISTAYHSIANDGFYVPLSVLRGAYRSDDTPLSRTIQATEQRLDSATIYLIKSAMHQVFTEGTSKRAYQSIDQRIKLAGKTGTTNDLRDSWIAAFGGQYSTVVWVGRDDNKTTPLTSSTGALPIWTQIMAAIESQSFSHNQPDNIIYQWVDTTSDSLSAPQCSNAVHLPFVIGSQPRKRLSSCALFNAKKSNKINSNSALDNRPNAKAKPKTATEPSKPWWKRLGF